MAFTRVFIEKKLGGITCPQGDCDKIGEGIINILLEGSFKQTESPKYYYDVDFTADIIKEFARYPIVPIWLETGSRDGSRFYRAQHLFYVYNINPILIFSVWEKGLAFYSEEESIQKIKEAINICTVGVSIWKLGKNDPDGH
jgi:hypothetical protein